jgi:hypothetical protein
MKIVLKKQPSNRRPNVFSIEISKFFGVRDLLIRMMCNKKSSMLMILWTIIYVGDGYCNTIITTIVVFGGVYLTRYNVVKYSSFHLASIIVGINVIPLTFHHSFLNYEL